MNQTTPTYLVKTKSFAYEKRATQASRTASNDATEPLTTRNERDERKEQSMEPCLA